MSSSDQTSLDEASRVALRGSKAARLIRSARLRIAIGILLFAVVAVPVALASWLPIPDADTQSLTDRLAPPFSDGHLLGTDQLGRDLLSRLLHGGQISLFIGLLAILTSGVFGVLMGITAGYFGRWVDAIISRLLEAQMSLPLLMLLLLVIALFGPSIAVVVLVLAFAQWPEPARLARGLTLVEREKTYVDAARVLGKPHRSIIVRHILPNILSRVLVVVMLLLANAVLLESALSYLGVGVSRPYPTWGRIISDGQQYVTSAWWLVTIPGVMISILVIGVNLLGDGLRDLTDRGHS